MTTATISGPQASNDESFGSSKPTGNARPALSSVVLQWLQRWAVATA